MDEEAVRETTEAWTSAGLIDEETAAAIRTFESDREPEAGAERRVAWIVAVMGGILVGAGILTFLAAQWDDLGEPIRTAILIATPVVVAAGGVGMDRRELPRAGQALWIVAAILVGPCLILLAGLHTPDVSEEWLLLGWGVIALPMGHAYRTRLGTGLGLVVLLLASTFAGKGDTGLFVAALLGAVMIAASVPLRSTAPELIETYLTVGIAPVVGVYLWLNTQEGRLEFVEVVAGPFLLAGLGLAVGAGGAVLMWERSNRADTGDVLSVAIGVAGAILALVLVTLGAILPDIAVYMIGQAVLLCILIALVVVGMTTGSRMLINLVMLGFLLQVLTLLVTLADQLPGTIALIVAGLVLLVVAIALERGRRRLLARLPQVE